MGTKQCPCRKGVREYIRKAEASGTAAAACSGKNFLDNGAVDVGEPVVAADMVPCELGVVKTELMEDGGVQVVDMNFSVDNSIAHIVCFSPEKTLFDAAAGKPGSEAFWLVFASVGVDVSCTAQVLAPGCPSKFAAPDNESIIEKSALAEVADECRSRLVRLRTAKAGHREYFRDDPSLPW